MFDPSTALFAFFTDEDKVSMAWGSKFAGLSDLEKLEVLDHATALLMEKTSSIIVSLEVQRTSQAGQQKIQ